MGQTALNVWMKLVSFKCLDNHIKELVKFLSSVKANFSLKFYSNVLCLLFTVLSVRRVKVRSLRDIYESRSR